MGDGLRVLVHGTGFAGQGHAAAFRAAGAEIVGMVGRTAHVVEEVAGRMGIPHAGTDWAEALEVCKPDVVSVATPGGAHFEPIRQAIAAGAHVFCDKPMTESGETAAELRRLAEEAGVKTCYAASFRYTPSVLHAQRLVADGAIGEPTEVECMSHFNLEREIPFGWSHQKSAGGGRLNNNFTHTLSIVTSVVGEGVREVFGDVRDDLGRAPIVEGVHDFTKRRSFIPKDLDDPSLKWGESDVEWSYTVLARIESALARQPVSVLFKHGGLVPRFGDDHIVFYGTEGAIHLKGHYGSGQLSLHDGSGWTDLPLPDDIAAEVPDVEGETEQCWHRLVRDFTRDIRGEAVAPYPTFREGARYQAIIDVIRASAGWTDVRHLG
ncbi:myo-inositol 2-dehydrogenase [Oceanicola granulosus HTCC2516]|uniref:Myo-inositol 2-dehydrogenase n=1 Tax=Oceanicola granulosus (strain ATCC BAA-861 / DSM 15982 / KCTC 12143 / HTCC2516) TaxID=314256 RepID=Q2CIM9_OCEGH|nr:Gfo/Idh/MocA family oxidoreductase [Oceanicola granulosus]EAR52560.1 myo-inositol 2-dehydrogenase [Oceanicola granulosus HTCC2516]